MDWLRPLLDWAGDSANSNLVRTVVALLAVPGALWGGYLFVRWMRGSGIDAQLDALNRKIDDITIETPDGERITYPASEIDEVVRAIDLQRYQFLGVQFSLRDVLRNSFSSINNANWRNTGDEYNIMTEQTAWHVLGKVPQLSTVAQTRSSDVRARINESHELIVTSDAWMAGRIAESLEACQLIGRIVSDAIALNLLSIYRADGHLHTVSSLAATKFGMAVMKKLMLQG